MGPDMTPKASILIPSYNAQNWVAQAIESALAQGSDVEVIVVDDGSTDGTVDVIRQYDGKIHWETGPNAGAPVARNRALELATAPWVQYLDADDYLLPGKIEEQLAAVSELPHTDVLYGPETIEWHRQGEVVETWDPLPPPHDPFALLALWKLPQTGAPLWRRQALLDVNGWTVGQPCCQEHELYLRLLMAGKTFVYHPASKGAVYRRFETGTLSTRKPAKVRRERAKIETRLEAYLQETGQMTPERQWAINQARFDMARASWAEDKSEARAHHAAISDKNFKPRGANAPGSYRAIYNLFGFEAAENAARLKRVLSSGSGGTHA